MTTPSTCTRAKLGAALLCCTILSLLSGCSAFHRNKTVGCTEKPFSLSTETRPPLKVPEGLSAPDTRNAIKVPDLGNSERVRAASEPCLSHPPSYFSKPLNVAQPKPPPKPKKWWQFWRKAPPPSTSASAAPAATAPVSPPSTPAPGDAPPPK